MSAYFVIGILIAVGAVVLSAIGLTREDFPPNDRAARAVVAGTLVAVVAGVVALLMTTHVEHPREEAAEAAAEKAGEEKVAQAGKSGQVGAPKPGERVAVSEDEFSVALEGGNQLKPGPHAFAVANKGKIQHDLAIEGSGLPDEPKTPLIDPGKTADLKADLKAGKYKFYCTVPGHEQSGMKTEVTVR